MVDEGRSGASHQGALVVRIQHPLAMSHQRPCKPEEGSVGVSWRSDQRVQQACVAGTPSAYPLSYNSLSEQ